MGYSYDYQGVHVTSNIELSETALDVYVGRGWRKFGTSLKSVDLVFRSDGSVDIGYEPKLVKLEETIDAIPGYISKVF